MTRGRWHCPPRNTFRRLFDEDAIFDHDGGGDGRLGNWFDRLRLWSRWTRRRWRWRARRWRIRWRRCAGWRRDEPAERWVQPTKRWIATIDWQLSVVQPTGRTAIDSVQTSRSSVNSRCATVDTQHSAEHRSRFAAERRWRKHWRQSAEHWRWSGESSQHWGRWLGWQSSFDIAQHSAGNGHRFRRRHRQPTGRGIGDLQSAWHLAATRESPAGTRRGRWRGSARRRARESAPEPRGTSSRPHG